MDKCLSVNNGCVFASIKPTVLCFLASSMSKYPWCRCRTHVDAAVAVVVEVVVTAKPSYRFLGRQG